MKVAICMTGKSYLPEAFAYESYLCQRGHIVERIGFSDLWSEADAHIRFLGFDPKGSNRKYPGRLIHEYHSLSTGRRPKVKNFLKKLMNGRPDGRIFLSEAVAEGYSFADKVPYIYRDMGVDNLFFEAPQPSSKEFDIVYCGSLSRVGLIEVLVYFASAGYKVLVIGGASKEDRESLKSHKNIHVYGSAEREEIPSLLKLAVAGLNYTPNIYPFNIQTSTKVLEYCAAGLGVISNRYHWVKQFEKRRAANFLWFDAVPPSKEEFERFEFNIPHLRDLSWDSILETCDFESFLSEK